METLKKYLTFRLLMGILLGSVAGYAYYYYIGCSSGTCPITSNPVNTTLYGALFGAVLFFKERKAKPKDNETQAD